MPARPTDPLDLTSVRVVILAADLGSISAASQQLGLALAAASERISRLESNLGVKLFDRSIRGVRLTPAGEQFVPRARMLLADSEHLGQEFRELGRGLRGHVRLWSNTSALLQVLPQRLVKFARQHPDILVQVEERGSPEVVSGLLDGRADLGVVDVTHAPAGLELRDLFTDTLVLVLPQGHRLAGARALLLSQALDEDFITLPPDTALALRLSTAAAQAGMVLKVRQRMRSFDAVCRLVAAGAGISALPLQAIAPQRAALPLAVVSLQNDWAVRTHRLAWRHTSPQVPAAHTLAAWLLDAAGTDLG